jgi:transposase-like protein
MSIETEQEAFAAREETKRRAIERYRTTTFSVRAIAKDAGVSLMTLYRWLHDEGVPLRRHADNDAATSSDEEPPPIHEYIVELRRRQTMLVGQVAKLEELIQSLVALNPQPA